MVSLLTDPIVTDTVLADYLLVSNIPATALKKTEVATGETLTNQARVDAIVLSTTDLAQYVQGPIDGLVGTVLSGINDADGVELTNTQAVAGILTSTQLATYLMVDDTENGVPSDALLNTTANQTAVGAILTTTLLDGYLTTDNLAAVTNHLGTRGSGITNGYYTGDTSDPYSATYVAGTTWVATGSPVLPTGYDNVWQSIQTMVTSVSNKATYIVGGPSFGYNTVWESIASLVTLTDNMGTRDDFTARTANSGYDTIWESIASLNDEKAPLTTLGNRDEFTGLPATGYDTVWESIDTLSETTLGDRDEITGLPATGYDTVWESIDTLSTATESVGTRPAAYASLNLWGNLVGLNDILVPGFLGSRSEFPSRPNTGYDSVWESIQSLSEDHEGLPALERPTDALMPAVATMAYDIGAFDTIWSSIERLAQGYLGIYMDLGYEGVDQYNITGPPPGFHSAIRAYKPARMVNAFHPNVNLGPTAANRYGLYAQWVTDTQNSSAVISIAGAWIAGDNYLSTAGVSDNIEWAATGMGYTDSCVKFGQGYQVSNTVRYGLSTQMGVDQNTPYFDHDPFTSDWLGRPVDFPSHLQWTPPLAAGYVLKTAIGSISAVTVNTDHFEILVPGYYKFCNTMLFTVPEWEKTTNGHLPGRDPGTSASATLQYNQPKNIMSNFVVAKNTVPSDPYTGVTAYELLIAMHGYSEGNVKYKRFGPIGASAYIQNSSWQNNGSSSISEVRWCEGGDRVGVSLEAETYFAHGDKFQRVCTPATGSTFTAELIFAGVGDTTYVHPYAGVYLGPDGIPNVA